MEIQQTIRRKLKYIICFYGHLALWSASSIFYLKVDGSSLASLIEKCTDRRGQRMMAKKRRNIFFQIYLEAIKLELAQTRKGYEG